MSILKFLTTYSLTLFIGLLSLNAYAEFIELKSFNENPGNLSASYFSPNSEHPNIVVLLHGCVQEGESFAKKSGLLSLAKKHEFALLMPQQSLDNNIKRCFNWYSANDYTKDEGENLSIKNMIITLKQQLGSERIYIIGLSGGGAMASSMLVNYPELFNAGAVVAGIPFPCANGLITAISCMKNGPSQTADNLTLLVNEINPQRSIWPKISVWTGENDAIVNPLNSSALADHWASLSGIIAKPKVTDLTGYTLTEWKNKQKETQVELIVVANRGHGMMVNPNEINGGETADYLLESPISTAKHIIGFWQLSAMNK
jgi:poly(hydroxyalkanoate) depolymerase family esterase